MKTSLEFKFGSLALATALGALQLQPGIAAESQPSALDLARQLNDAFVNVAADVSQSVVVIQVAYANDRSAINVEESPWFDSLPDSLKRYFAPDPEEETEPEEEPREPRFSGNGSGIILNQDGFILTNHHVVEDAAKIRVRLKDGREFEAVVQGTDELSEIAVIKLEGDLPNDLKPAMFANSDEIRVGEYAIAIGAPFALDYSVTVGHVSAVGRSSVVPSYMKGNSMDQDFIQTDANINPGNSGGPLVNLDGKVMGINTLIKGMGTGIGFAVPSNLARNIAEVLIKNGKFERAWLGIAAVDIREHPYADQIAPGLKEGMVVAEIPQNAPVYDSDLKPSDVIVAVDGVKVTDISELRSQVRAKPLGSTLMLDIVRGTEKLQLAVKTGRLPGARAARGGGVERQPMPDPDIIPLGISVESVDSDTAKNLGVKQDSGVVVVEVKANSPAAKLGIVPGTVITDVNHRTIGTIADYENVIAKADLAKGVLINFVDVNGNSRFEIIKE